jgi:glycosyltransferase involved in cell wall biosynthesis
MRILVLHAQLGTLRGGGENFTRNLFTSFVTFGHRATAAFTADLRGGYPFSLPPGLEPLPMRGWWSETIGQSAMSAVGRRLRQRQALRQNWDYVQNAIAWRTFRWNGRRFHKAVVRRLMDAIRQADAVYVHCNAVLASEIAQIRPTVLRLPGPLSADSLPVLESIHAVCANGDALARIRTFLGDRALELPVGLDQDRFSPGLTQVRAKLGWTPEHDVIGYVGRLSHIKGIDILTTGFQRLAAERPQARLLLIGSGEEERNVQAALRPHLERGLVHVTGDIAHDQLPLYYRAMDVLVMPSRYENYSNAILEGLACEVPFVGSNVGGNSSLSGTGAGWLFEPGSPESLAETLATALADRADRAERGRRGREHVRGRYSWAVSARRLEEILAAVGTPA